MKYKILCIFSLLLFFAKSAFADNAIRVLMNESHSGSLPSAEAESIDRFTGKLFHNGHLYSGSLEVLKDKNGLYVIKNVPFEEYIEGVVASEIGLDWEIEALKAQAVISRTYAMFFKNRNAGNRFHITSSIRHQVYKGENRDPLIAYAVKATKGEVLTYKNMPIKAFFHATCVGKTEHPDEVWEESLPYLRSVECNGNNSPYDSWQRTFSKAEIAAALGTGSIKDLSIASYTATGRVKTVRIIAGGNRTGHSGREVKATDLRKLLGYKELPSTNFSLTIKGGDIIFAGKGYGHGVGLSQWGALEMARQGKKYREILSHYYPGTALKNSDALPYRDLASKMTP